MAIRSKYSLVILFLACETKNNEGEKKKTKKIKSQQHLVFPGGHPSKY